MQQALENENVKIDEDLIQRCVDVGVGSVGTTSSIQLIGVVYNLYKQQLAVSEVLHSQAIAPQFFQI